MLLSEWLDCAFDGQMLGIEFRAKLNRRVAEAKELEQKAELLGMATRKEGTPPYIYYEDGLTCSCGRFVASYKQMSGRGQRRVWEDTYRYDGEGRPICYEMVVGCFEHFQCPTCDTKLGWYYSSDALNVPSPSMVAKTEEPKWEIEVGEPYLPVGGCYKEAIHIYAVKQGEKYQPLISDLDARTNAEGIEAAARKAVTGVDRLNAGLASAKPGIREKLLDVIEAVKTEEETK